MPLKLSVVIVNYNVKYFLEQALYAVEKAMGMLSVEVIVVDNNSVDGSVDMLQKKFPSIKVIANKENKGFSFANNQAIKMSQGEYVLLLNPDTVVEESTFEKVVNFMDLHPDAGGLGVKMIDGSGNYLPESKRGLPTPAVAFCKIFGLSALFPKSRMFGKYHLGFLDKNQIAQVDVLSGAFMLLRKTVLDKTGLLDENFFMYGEDIDLSYRITKAGYKNYYFPETCIIHYKGESTKKSSVNYVFVFYRAMIIFAEKHFSKQNAKLFSNLIHLAIYFRAFLALLSRLMKTILLPLIDAVLIFTGMFFIKNYWELTIKVSEGLHYPIEYIRLVVPAYIVIWLTFIYFNGGYDKPLKISKSILGVFGGTLFILVVYALLPESFRFSRAIIVLGTVWAMIALTGIRILFSLTGRSEFSVYGDQKKKIIIVGDEEEGNRVLSLLNSSETKATFLGFVRPKDDESSAVSGSDSNSITLGKISQLSEMIDVYQPDEIIFCSKNISSASIIDLMSKIKSGRTEFKIAPPESLFIIGSNSVENPGDLYIFDLNSITRAVNRRNKILLDLVLSFVFIILFPILLFFIKNPFGFLRNMMLVLVQKKSWVGYKIPFSNLPAIKPGVVNSSDILKTRIDENTATRLNMLYAKNYSPWNDLNIVVKAFKLLGRSA